MEMDRGTLELRAPLPEEPPEWTALEHEQCAHCALDPGEHPRCPAAVALAPLVEAFDGLMSHDRCDLGVVTEERRIGQPDVPVQKALGALMGLVMAVSGCPSTARFRPMARFHLPLASTEETVYRATSTYLLAQHLRREEGLPADDGLDGLAAFYEEVRRVNKGMALRLRPVVATDSSLNAVVGLDTLTHFLPMAIEESLSELRGYFAPWLERDAGP